MNAERNKYGSIGSGIRPTNVNNNLQRTVIPPTNTVSQTIAKLGIAAVLVFALMFVIITDEPGKARGFHLKSLITSNVSSLTNELFYTGAIVDHYNPTGSGTFAQRYYEELDHFGGPGSPLFVIMGGEDELKGILYPYISNYLARNHSAYTICIEHRFYGKSMPVLNPSAVDLRKLLSPAQAMLDAIKLITHKQRQLGCGRKGSNTYCPVMAVGGSYPGVLAGLMRLVHSDIIDIGYASSAPFDLYWHKNHGSNEYFEKITNVAEEMSPGCAEAVKTTLVGMKNDFLDNPRIANLALKYGVCVPTIPSYIQSADIFAQEVLEVIATHIAENNMEYYPPGPTQDFYKTCKIFQAKNMTMDQKVKRFLTMRTYVDDCFDLTLELPPGPDGTISAGDWSGVGGGTDGLMWDFQTCYLNPEVGFSNKSMFPERDWTLEWQTQHCVRRFGLKPDLNVLVNRFGIQDFTGATHLLLTNGLRDGWSAWSTLETNEPGVKIINMPNGAHHSDLLHHHIEGDTEDVKDAHIEISKTVGGWLAAIKAEYGA